MIRRCVKLNLHFRFIYIIVGDAHNSLVVGVSNMRLDRVESFKWQLSKSA